MNYPQFTLANYLRIKVKISNSLFFAAAYTLLNLSASASAQVIPDNTLPNNSEIDQNENLIEILEGTTQGSNLFHSFEQFSLIQGETAWFQNATTIDNIITRVTGGSLSSIDGLIRANGTANLFFLNPKGIIFGANAKLDIGGSFVGTTADSLKFSNGSEFSAIDPQAPPLLTVNITPGLQYGTGNGEIVVQGQGNLLAFTPGLTVDRSARPVGLQVDAGKTLALVGNNIFVEGGNLTAEAGNIELGSVGDNSLVQLNSTDSGWSLNEIEVGNVQNIILSGSSSLEVSGNNGGDVKLQGKQVIVTDGSAILADTFGDRDGGTLQVNASELLVVAGTSKNFPFISRLSTDVAPTATGNGGDIELNTSSLIVTGGAQVLSSSYSGSDTGNIKVKAKDVELSSGSRYASSSGLFTLVFGSGHGGDINIEANNVSVLDGGQAAALTFGAGTGGNLNVEINSLEVIGTSPGGFGSSLATNSQGMGDGGDLTIHGDFLLVDRGGSIQSSVFSSGNGGKLTVNANRIELLSGAPGAGPSGIFANVEQGATGNGGKLSIEAESLIVANGAQVGITTFDRGNAETLDIKAKEIQLIGTSPGGFPSSLASLVGAKAIGNGGIINIDTESLSIVEGAQIFVVTRGEGDSGNLNINADNLTVKQGAQIAVSTRGLGDGGTLDINAKTIELIGRTELGASGVFGNAVVSNGNGGDIRITTNDLAIRDGATINVSNFSSGNADVPPGTGTAGNININSQNMMVDGADSSITAATFAGSGGNIVLNSNNINLTNAAQVTAETSGLGDGGSISISANEFNLNNQAQVSVNSTGEGQAGNIEIAVAEDITLDESEITATSLIQGGGDIELKAEFTSLDHESLISTSVLDSTGGGGDLIIDSDYIIANHDSDLEADAVFGPGGNINITTQAIFFSLDSEATASSQFGVDGVVEIENPNADEQIGIAVLESEVVDRAAMISSFCSVATTGSMIVSGKGGLGENPSQALRGQSVWEDLRDFSLASDQHNAISATTSQQQSATILEANNWRVNAQGKVELVSQVTEAFNLCNKETKS